MQMMIPMDLGQILQNTQGMKSGKGVQVGEGEFAALLQQLFGAEGGAQLDASVLQGLTGEAAQNAAPQSGEEAGMEEMLENLLGQETLSGEELAQVLTLLGAPGQALPEQVQQMLNQGEEIPVAMVRRILAAISPRQSDSFTANPKNVTGEQPVAKQAAQGESVGGQPAGVVKAGGQQQTSLQQPQAQTAQQAQTVQQAQPVQQAQQTQQTREFQHPLQFSQPPAEEATTAQAAPVRQESASAKGAQMDPRFAELLGGRESSSARQVIQAPEQPTSGQNQATSLIAEMSKTEGEAGSGSKGGDSGFFSQRGEIFQAASQPAGQETGQTFSFENVRPTATPTPQAAATTGAEVKLPSGQVVPDSHILDQVIEKAALHNTRGRNSLTVRLHPEELGELRLELVLEKGALRAHVHAQSHQVQEVLERNMFRLREALEQHGLRLDEVEVSVDDGSEGQEKDLWHRQQQERFAAQGKPGTRNGLPAEAVQMANPQPKASSGGINLRV